MSHRREIGDILKLVEGWPAEDRENLAQELLSVKSQLAPAPRDTLRHAAGMLKRAGPPPTDDEVAQVRWEAVKEKYLQ